VAGDAPGDCIGFVVGNDIGIDWFFARDILEYGFSYLWGSYDADWCHCGVFVDRGGVVGDYCGFDVADYFEEAGR
jgi:hypothetical protein